MIIELKKKNQLLKQVSFFHSRTIFPPAKQKYHLLSKIGSSHQNCWEPALRAWPTKVHIKNLRSDTSLRTVVYICWSWMAWEKKCFFFKIISYFLLTYLLVLNFNLDCQLLLSLAFFIISLLCVKPVLSSVIFSLILKVNCEVR